MAVPELEVGKRLLAAQVDHLAQHEPERLWASIPRHGGDLSIGYRDITFKRFANAINHAAFWLEKNLAGTRGDFETFTYNGPFDALFPILAVAAAKLGKRMLLISPYCTPAAVAHLLTQSNCNTYIHSPYFTARIKPLLDAMPHIRGVEAPLLNVWLDGEDAPHMPYEKTWEEAADDEWLVFHTSGTTGLPKMATYTNKDMSTFDAAHLMPDAADENTLNQVFKNQRFFTTIPHCHTLGMTASLQWPVFMNNVFVGGPTTGPITPAQAVEVMKLGKVNGVVTNPAVIEEICRGQEGLEILRGMEWVCFIGAPLPRHVALQLNQHTIVMPGMGTTEAGTYWTSVCESEDWDCYKFRAANGLEMEPAGGDLYEAVFVRKPEYEPFQQIFRTFPDVDRFPTRDLWTRHPNVPDGWLYAGRLDDVVVLSLGQNVVATDLQHMIQEAPGVKVVLVGGELRPRPFILVDLVDKTPLSEEQKQAKLDEIWPTIERANETMIEKVRFQRDLIIFTEPSKPLPLTIKGTVVRLRALELYANEIDQIYNNYQARITAEAAALVAAATAQVTEPVIKDMSGLSIQVEAVEPVTPAV